MRTKLPGMRGVLPGVIAGLMLLCGARAGTIDFKLVTPTTPEIESAILGAGAQWAKYLDHSGSLEVQVQIVADSSTFLGRSTRFEFLQTQNGYTLYQPSAAFELVTGTDFFGPETPDLRFEIGSAFLDQLWFDPDPINRTGVLPSNRIDAVSAFMREFSRVFARAGYYDASTDTFPSTFGSTFDRNVTRVGNAAFFSGANAVAAFGAPVPLRLGAPYDLGNPGTALENTLMGSAALQPGVRYEISALDVAILADTGLQTLPVPEPGAVALIGLGLAAVLWRRRAHA